MNSGALRIIAILFASCLSNTAISEITDFHIADVTSNSFTIVFSNSDAVVAPDVNVYQDAAGQISLTSQSQIISTPQQHQNGLSAIRVNSLTPSTTYYFNTTADIHLSPYFPDNNLPSVTTFSMVPATSGNLIVNDLSKLDIYRPDSIASLEGAIVLLSIPSVSPYSVSSFVEANDFAYIDMNNLLAGNSDIHLLESGQNLEIKILRGLLCDNAAERLQVFYRKHGGDLKNGTQVNLAQHCEAADTVCDDQINVLDVQFVLSALYSTSSDCRYSSELDIVQDQTINVLDVQQILNYF